MKSWFAESCRNVHSFTYVVPKYIWAVSAGPFWTKMSIPLPISLKKNSVFYSLVAIFKCNESLFTDLILQCWFLKAQCCFGCSHTELVSLVEIGFLYLHEPIVSVWLLLSYHTHCGHGKLMIPAYSDLNLVVLGLLRMAWAR